MANRCAGRSNQLAEAFYSAASHSNQAIADQLIIAVSTVKKHINNIYGKLDMRSHT